MTLQPYVGGQNAPAYLVPLSLFSIDYFLYIKRTMSCQGKLLGGAASAIL